MTAHILGYVELSEEERRIARDWTPIANGDALEVRLRGGRPLALPRPALDAIRHLLVQLANGQHVAILATDREISPNEAAKILGMARPLVVHRMDIGDLPFRYIGKNRRVRLADVLTFKAAYDRQTHALEALSEETERLIVDHEL